MELFDILNQDGTKTGQIKERCQVHRDGDLHGSVHIWIIKDGKALLQKRAMTKESFSGCFDVASSGHVDAGETYVMAAVRELEEETGVVADENQLIPLFMQRLNVRLTGKSAEDPLFVSNEINQVYLAECTVNLESLHPQKSEIDYFEWVPLDKLRALLLNQDIIYKDRLTGRNNLELIEINTSKLDYCISLEEFEGVLEYYLRLDYHVET